jgi:hypothetical protein
MKLLMMVVLFFAYGTFASLYHGEAGNAVAFPTFDPPEINFQEIPAGCGGFADCIEYVGNIIINVVLGVIYIVLLIARLVIFMVQFLAVLAANAFVGIDGVPPWANGLLIVLFGTATGIIAFKAFRKGDTEA